MNRRTLVLLGSVFGMPGLLAVSPGAYAQQAVAAGAIEEILVTAQRRAERQLDVPISITALSQEQLTTGNVQDLSDISRLTPSLRFDNQTGFAQPTIRGIGTGITTSGGGSNVGIYVDGFYSPNPLAADFQLLNVRSVQVLKGPQGTLFGRNTTGGAILVTTAEPSAEPRAEARVSYGRFAAQRYQGYSTFGLGTNVAMDIEGIYAQGRGFQTNILNGDNKVGAYDNWTVRSGLKFQASDNVSILFRYTHSSLDDPTSQLLNSNTDATIDITTGQPWGIQTYQIPGTFTTDPDLVAVALPRFVRNKTDIAQLTVRADLGFAEFSSYTQYREEDVDQSEHLGQTGFTIFQLGLPVRNQTYSQEFLLTSAPGPRLQWTAGAFFVSNKDQYYTFVDNTVATTGRIRLGGSSTNTQSYAGFVDGTYELNSQLFLTVGARYAHDLVKNAFYNPRFSGNKTPVPGIKGDKVTPRAVIRYKPTEQSSVYASYTKGYKAAIIDVGGSCQNTPFICNNIRPEDVDAFEVGYKVAERGLSLELSAFYYDYKNLQVSEFLGNAQAFIVNAAKSRIYGLEAAINYDLTEHLQLTAAGSWTHARYKQFGDAANGAPIYASCPANPATLAPRYVANGSCTGGNINYVNVDTILRDVHMQHVPDWTASVGARYTTGMTSSGEFALSGNLYYTSKFYFSPSGTQFLQPDYATLTMRAQWNDPNDRFMIAAFGDNITGKRYRTQVQYNGFGIGATWSAPAVWGVEVGVKF